MFARRNFRRNLVIAVCLPVAFLGLIVIHHNRNSIYEQEEYQTQTIQSIRSKRLTNEQTSVNSFERFNPGQGYMQQWKSFDGLMYPVYNATNLERFVHLDLKGAAPIVSYYEKLFPFLKRLGATGLLIEYEDMFPYTGRLEVIKHGLAYSKDDIEKILNLARTNNLKVMPLLQVYGHLEYVLKLKEFMHLREDNRYPQVITPCLEESYQLLFGISKHLVLFFFFLIVYNLNRYDRSNVIITSINSVSSFGL
mgnify:FL=1